MERMSPRIIRTMPRGTVHRAVIEQRIQVSFRSQRENCELFYRYTYEIIMFRNGSYCLVLTSA